MKDISELKFPEYLSTSYSTITVKGLMDASDMISVLQEMLKGMNKDLAVDTMNKFLLDKFIEGKGYVDTDGSVWIFCREKPSKYTRNAYPYFWFNVDDDLNVTIEKSKPSELIMNAYNIDHMVDASVTTVIDTTKENEQLYDEAEILDINASVSFYVPIIYDTDDFLKKIVKIIIIEKGIDINRLKSKTDLPYMLPNMKTALQNKTKMSVNYFVAWMELLGCTIDVRIRDNGYDRVNPLKEDHIYDTEKDIMSVVIDGKPHPIDMSKYYRRTSQEEDVAEAEASEGLLNMK